MSSDIAIQVEKISKHFLMFEKPEHRLKQMIVPRLQRFAGQEPKTYYRDFIAVNDVSIKIQRGSTVGIIGRNGSGKSTLLQMICGTLQPSHGSVHVNGRIAALLELGAGFNPEFTGRENVYMNAAILGLSRKETEDRFEEIERFADIGIFIDQPVKSYSSGMYVRLAFAVAINVEPDILIVDEALAVGDEAFQRKCFARIEQIKENGATILFVSHGAQAIVQLCDRAILMDRGEVILDGIPKTVVNQYQRFVNLTGDDVEPVREEIKAMDGWKNTSDSKTQELSITKDEALPEQREKSPEEDESWFDPSLISESHVGYQSSGAEIKNVRIETLDGRQVNNLVSGEKYVYKYDVYFTQTHNGVGFGMLIKTTNGNEVGGAATDFKKSLSINRVMAGTYYKVHFEFHCFLNSGTYFTNAGVTTSADTLNGYAHRLLDALAFRVLPNVNPTATGTVNFLITPTHQISESQA
ncbi:MAG: ABC transporter ATP-binding protein [Hyphomicrobiales bacterium]